MTARTGAVNRDAERGAGGAAGAREHDRHHRRLGHRRHQQFDSYLSKICFDWIKHFEQVDRVTCLALP